MKTKNIIDPEITKKQVAFSEKILVVDDDEDILETLELILKRNGYDVITAKNGEEAIKTIETIPLAIIICDQKMPGIGGIEVLQKASNLIPDTCRILLTGNTDLSGTIDAINVAKINHYISKPWDNKKILETIHSTIEKYRLVNENKKLQELIQKQHLSLAEKHEKLQRELTLGGKIHEKLLLGKTPTNIPGFTIEALSVPSKEVDGDFFEFYQPSTKVFDVVIGDVMGKGIAAALVGTAVKTQMIRFSMPFPEADIYNDKKGWHHNLLSPDNIMNQVDKAISKQLIELEFFVTLFYGRFDIQFKKFSYIDAGSPKPIHYQAAEQKAILLQGENYPLGITEGNKYFLKDTSFNKGDIFVFYSDGVSEARSPDEQFYGVERLIHLVEGNQDLKARDLINLIRSSITAFTKQEHHEDDLTLIVIKIGHYERPDLAEVASMQFRSIYSQLPAVRKFVERFCVNAPGNHEKLAIETQLLIDEIFCNIVKHGYEGNDRGMIHVKTELTEDCLIINVFDQGKSFDPRHVNEPSLAGNRDGGYGWHIIRELTDKIIYIKKENDTGWNHLTIFKKYHIGGKEMEFAQEQKENILIITPEKESLDASDAPEFKDKVIELITESKSMSVVFDLNKLQFIDSSGLGSFLSVLRTLNARGGDLKLARMNGQIRTMFELVKMHKIFEIYNSTEDAIESFK
jgi:sigma-B regulation protein RsbU (phosphoserine phosphatase)